VTESVYLEDVVVDERIVLTWIFRKNDDRALHSFIRHRIEARGCYEYGNTFGFHKIPGTLYVRNS
jgi:hypothetical protein